MGRFDRQPHMIPVTLTFHGVSHPKQFHYEVLNNAKITPAAMMATVFNAIQGMNEYGEDTRIAWPVTSPCLAIPNSA